MAQLAVVMDQEGPENPLQGEEAYFDGSHSQYIGYKKTGIVCISSSHVVHP